LYAYGSSLGGILLGRYLQSKSKKLDGAGIFCAPYDVAKGHDYFYSCCFGMYSYLIGQNLASNMNKYIIPQLVKYCPDKDFAQKIEHSFATNTTGLKKIDLDLYIPMFGYKNCDDYN